MKEGIIGIGYICWVIYGVLNDVNVYLYCFGNLCLILVYNGIIENYVFLKIVFEKEGYVFNIDMDIEVLVYFIEEV